MGIESNKEAYQMVKNTLGSIENRFREAYNKGYKDGLRDGASQVTAKLVSKILEETEADTPQTETQMKTQNSNLTFEKQTDEPPMDEYYKDHDEFYDCDRYVITNDEGERAYNCIGCQTDCPWK